MIELLFVACLTSSPAICEERSELYLDVSRKTCLTRAQPQLARWTGQNPEWQIARWSCHSVDDGRARDA